MNDQNYSFEKEWKEVDQLESKGLPKSSLEVIDSIYKTAKASNNEVQMLKAFIRKNSINIEIQEDAIDSLYLIYKNEIIASTNTNAAILKSILAESLNSYLQQNMWQIQERTPLSEHNENQAIQTWDIRRFHEEIQKLYLSSVYNLKDRTVQTAKYNALIANPSKEYLLSIYDLLLYRASEFFKSSNSHITEPVYKFTLNKAEYFSSNSEFSKIKITTKDSSSSIFQALLLFQDGIKHHLSSKNENALIDLDIRRIEFLNQNAIIPNKQELYIKALDQLIKSYSNNPELLRVFYLKAISYYSEGNQYDVKNKTGNSNGFIEAMQVIETANKKYGGVSEQLGDLKSVIQQKHLEFDIEAINIPDKPILLKCKVKNLDKVYAKIIPISNKEYFEYVSEQNYQNKQKKIELFISKKGLTTNSYTLKKMDDYQFHETELMLSPLKTGNYIVAFCEQPEFKSNQIFTTKLVQISKIAWFFRDNKQAEKEFSLVDRETGQQLKNVKATIYQWLYDNRENKFNKISNFVSDKNGKIIIPQQKNNSYLVEFINGKDSLFTEYNYYNYENYYRNDYHKNIFLFTDRSIYRPGQIVYFKGIVANREILPKVEANDEVEIYLRDANYQVVSKLRLYTNDFGSFNGSFVLPTNGLTGNFTIDCFGVTQIIRVEEYKRPTFEAKFDPTEGSYQLGESITFKGKAIGYTGSALNDATVKYRITRKKDYPYWPWWYSRWIPNRNSAAVEIDNGVLQTQPDGSFEVKFVAKADDVVDKDKPRFQFEITADVTDITGETHAANTSIYVCEIPFVINTNIEEKIDKNKDNNWHISTANHNNQVMKTTVKLKVYSLIQPKTTFINRMWEAPEYQVLTKSEFQKNFPNFSYDGEEFEYNWKKDNLVFEKQLISEATDSLVMDLKSWKTGSYVIEITANDDKGKQIEKKQFFKLYDLAAKEIPTNQPYQLTLDKASYEPGDNCNLFLTTKKASNLYYEVEKQGEIISNKWLKLDGTEKFNFPIQESDRGNFHFNITFVQNNRFYQESQTIEVPWTNKDLTIEYETFRDKLLPGEDEVWKLKIKGYKKDKLFAELLATMYDASLDQFVPHNFNKPILFPTSSPIHSFQNYGFNLSSLLYNSKRQENIAYLRNFTISYPYFIYRNVFTLNYPNSFHRSRNATMDAVRVTGGLNAMNMKMEASEAKINDPDTFDDTQDKNSKEENKPIAPLQPRTNLNETVFFYPNLETDAEGNVLIKFKMNDALTKWKFLAFAHDKQLATAITSKEIVTQKDLMILPFAPRFLRSGDTITFTGKVTNMSKNDLNGTAKLEFWDAITGEDRNKQLSNISIEKTFHLQPTLSEKVEWKLVIPNEIINTLKFRISAHSGNFTDAEENVIPVVTNRMLVTESLPLPVGPNQTKTFVLKNMKENPSNTIINHRFTLEFTPNPVWYAVKALPYLMEYPHECSEQLFNRFYANSLANYIANSTPKIKAIFESWKNNPAALKSNLEQNQELKSALLEETPWVVDAQNEATQRKNIALLFDLNKMAFEKEKALKKLSDRVANDGGISWFPGGRPNDYITQYILEGIGHLKKLGVDITNELSWLTNSINYIDRSFIERYERLLQMSKEGKIKLSDDNLDYMTIHYLYTKTFFNESNNDAKLIEAKKYYLDQAKKYWKKGLYNEGMIALILNRNNEKNAAKDIVKSLKERAIVNEEMGMYWKNNYGYYWYQLPIETHSLMVEAFSEISNDNLAVEQLKTWLLKNKQTNNWNTTKGTSNAIYALLLNGNKWLDADNSPNITLGNQKIDLSKIQKEAGSGYFKIDYKSQEISKDMATIKIENTNPVPSWGAIYWQYFEQLDKITTFQETPLTLVKKYFIEENSPTGPKLVEINPKKELKPGDKLKVRIELKVDRAMEFIHLKDMRPSNTEPTNVLSQYKWQDGLGYYESTKDLSSNFFIEYLPKGTFVFEYPLNIVREGNCSTGIATIQCMYAPEFSSHSNGLMLKVGK